MFLFWYQTKEQITKDIDWLVCFIFFFDESCVCDEESNVMSILCNLLVDSDFSTRFSLWILGRAYFEHSKASLRLNFINVPSQASPKHRNSLKFRQISNRNPLQISPKLVEMSTFTVDENTIFAFRVISLFLSLRANFCLVWKNSLFLHDETESHDNNHTRNFSNRLYYQR